MKTKNTDEFVATYKTSYQISEYDFAVATPSLKINKETTVGEIYEWFRLGFGKEQELPMHIKIIQMQEIDK